MSKEGEKSTSFLYSFGNRSVLRLDGNPRPRPPRPLKTLQPPKPESALDRNCECLVLLGEQASTTRLKSEEIYRYIYLARCIPPP